MRTTLSKIAACFFMLAALALLGAQAKRTRHSISLIPRHLRSQKALVAKDIGPAKTTSRYDLVSNRLELLQNPDDVELLAAHSKWHDNVRPLYFSYDDDESQRDDSESGEQWQYKRRSGKRGFSKGRAGDEWEVDDSDLVDWVLITNPTTTTTTTASATPINDPQPTTSTQDVSTVTEGPTTASTTTESTTTGSSTTEGPTVTQSTMITTTAAPTWPTPPPGYPWNPYYPWGPAPSWPYPTSWSAPTPAPWMAPAPTPAPWGPPAPAPWGPPAPWGQPPAPAPWGPPPQQGPWGPPGGPPPQQGPWGPPAGPPPLAPGWSFAEKKFKEQNLPSDATKDGKSPVAGEVVKTKSSDGKKKKHSSYSKKKHDKKKVKSIL